MDNRTMTKKSRFLSKHLRHSPERIGLTLEPGGWVLVSDLLKAARLTKDELDVIVANNNKKRFSYSDDGEKIRANQGHSVDVDLQLLVTLPPAILYHGSATKNIESIQKDGLTKQRRHHVHLSQDTSTATQVGGRHGKPCIFHIDAKRMNEDGFKFYVSANGVWLVDHVPAKYFVDVSFPIRTN